MTKERFVELIYKIQEYNEFIEKLGDMGVDLSNCKYIDYTNQLFEELMKSEFDESGLDLVLWWLYEDVDHLLYNTGDDEDGEMGSVYADLNNINDLYTYLTEGGRDEVAE